MLRDFQLDLEIVLSVLKSYHSLAVSSIEDTQSLVSMVADAIVATVRDLYTYLEVMEKILSRRRGVSGDRRAESESCSLEDILGNE